MSNSTHLPPTVQPGATRIERLAAARAATVAARGLVTDDLAALMLACTDEYEFYEVSLRERELARRLNRAALDAQILLIKLMHPEGPGEL